jgi:mRNA-degrading endonuclease RelE of RelBE toxin-antitoxin system
MAGYQFTEASREKIADFQKNLANQEIEILVQALKEIESNPFVSLQRPKAIRNYKLPGATAREYRLPRLNLRIIYRISKKQRKLDIFYIGPTKDAPGHR